MEDAVDGGFEIRRRLSTVLCRTEEMLEQGSLGDGSRSALQDVFRATHEVTAVAEGTVEPGGRRSLPDGAVAVAGSRDFVELAEERLSMAGFDLEVYTEVEEAASEVDYLVASGLMFENGLATELPTSLEDLPVVSLYTDEGLPMNVVRALVPPGSSYPESISDGDVAEHGSEAASEASVVEVPDTVLLSEGYEPFVEMRYEGREVVVVTEDVDEVVETAGRVGGGYSGFDPVSFVADVLAYKVR